MITKFVINYNNSYKLLLYYNPLRYKIYDDINRTGKRERLVLDLYYNQGKTYHEISKEARISPRD